MKLKQIMKLMESKLEPSVINSIARNASAVLESEDGIEFLREVTYVASYDEPEVYLASDSVEQKIKNLKMTVEFRGTSVDEFSLGDNTEIGQIEEDTPVTAEVTFVLKDLFDPSNAKTLEAFKKANPSSADNKLIMKAFEMAETSVRVTERFEDVMDD
jgi:hypothetical protein